MSEEMGIAERIARGLKAACIYKDMMGCRKLSRLSGVEFHTTRRLTQMRMTFGAGMESTGYTAGN